VATPGDLTAGALIAFLSSSDEDAAVRVTVEEGDRPFDPGVIRLSVTQDKAPRPGRPHSRACGPV